MDRRLIGVVMAIVFLIPPFSLSSFFATPTPINSTTNHISLKNAKEGVELPVVVLPTAQLNPAIWLDRIVWQDYRNDPTGNWTGTGLGNSDIYFLNLTTGVEKQITSNLTAQEKPAIWGDTIVWVDYRHGNADIYSYDLKTGVEKRITDDPADQLEPAIYDDKIVWRDLRQSPEHPMSGDIYMYDMKSGVIKPVSVQHSPPKNEKKWSDAKAAPAIYKSKIVWLDWRVSLVERYDTDIYMYDLGDDCTLGTEDDVTDYAIAKSTKPEVLPAIYGNKVVYLAVNGTYCDLSLYDAQTNSRLQIVSQRAAAGYRPAIFTSSVVWVDTSAVGMQDGNYDIYKYNFVKDELTPLCTHSGAQVAPALFGNITVWQDKRNGNWDIYAHIEPEPFNTPPKIEWAGIAPQSAKNDGFTEVRISAKINDSEANVECVYADLSMLAVGLHTKKLYDNGSYGDLKAYDNNYSLNFTISFCTKPQNYSIKIYVIDFEKASAAATVNFTVVSGVAPIMTEAVAIPPEIVNNGEQYVLFKVRVHEPDDFVKSVVIMLDAVGLKPMQMYDDGTHGDELKNDSVYSIKVRIPVQRVTQNKVIYVYATDSFNNVAKCMIFLKLKPPSPPLDVVFVSGAAIFVVAIVVCIVVLFEKRLLKSKKI